MAAELPLPPSPFFNIYNDAAAPILANTNFPDLPGGPCNYVDLTPGSNGKKCGCRRFWSRSALLGRGTPTGYPPEDQATWCACSHHACFHDDARDAPPTPIGFPTGAAAPFPPPASINGQENERPRTNREPLTPVDADMALMFPQSVVEQQHIDFHTFSSPLPPSFPDHMEEFVARPAGLTEPAGEQLLPDTLDWAELVQLQSQCQHNSLPPIPSQCLMASQTESTTSSVRIAYLKPFAGKGLNTLSGVKTKEPDPPPDQILPTDQIGSPAEDHQREDDTKTVTNTPGSSRYRDTPQPEERSPVLTVTRQSFNELSIAVESYKERIEALEQFEQEEPCDSRDHADSERVYDLEQRVLAVEKVLNADDETVYNETQDHTSSDSSQGHWEVEVVFLPFPLKSLWSGSCDFNSQHPLKASSAGFDSWTQLPNRTFPYDAHSPESGEWAGPEVESDWLFGRAHKSNNLIDQRLRSRGLVKTISVRNHDASSVNEAMVEAFGTLFQTLSRMQANVHHGATTHPRRAKFLGLETPWVPLRKVKHDSRLRFLTPAEMVTPATWTVDFLKSSVILKHSKMPRLFVTHPEAYLQDLDAYESGWTWQRLRGLSRVCADSQGSQEEAEDEEDPNWNWDSKLDENPHICPGYQVSPVYETAQQKQRTASVITSSEIFIDARSKSSSFASKRASSRAKSPAVLQERRYSRPPRLRTVSVPPTPQTLVSPAIATRRVTSYGHPYERYSSPQPSRPVLGRAQMVAVVKRRGTRSPSVPLRPRFSRFTPGMSTGARSPTPDLGATRFDTPYYATPYSMAAPLMETRPSVHDDVILIDGGDFDFGDNGETDADIYDDSDNASMADLGGHDDSHRHHHQLRQSQESSWQDGQGTDAPEDEPWPGIEDDENRDPEGINIHVDEDAMTDEDIGAGQHVLTLSTVAARAEEADDGDTSSQASSVPSEYPSNDPEWVTSGKEQEFRPFGS
ncbi:hypothetical protein F5Y16DRAFT_119864 [Xylariaceae sp. FL0255]|nr:hypothetical protein F5Y16DRAFT_119864 [Xylariaceae sp. FL0255]